MKQIKFFWAACALFGLLCLLASPKTVYGNKAQEQRWRAYPAIVTTDGQISIISSNAAYYRAGSTIFVRAHAVLIFTTPSSLLEVSLPVSPIEIDGNQMNQTIPASVVGIQSYAVESHLATNGDRLEIFNSAGEFPTGIVLYATITGVYEADH